MRTAKMSVDGKDRLLCFSTRVIRDVVDRFGDVSKINDALNDEDKCKALDNAVWLLSRMMDAGGRYARLNGIENPEPLSYEDLYDSLDIGDFTRLRQKIQETIVNGNQRTVDAVPGKNT